MRAFLSSCLAVAIFTGCKSSEPVDPEMDKLGRATGPVEPGAAPRGMGKGMPPGMGGGMVHPRDIAVAESIRDIGGVVKIVKVFDYID